MSSYLRCLSLCRTNLEGDRWTRLKRTLATLGLGENAPHRYTIAILSPSLTSSLTIYLPLKATRSNPLRQSRRLLIPTHLRSQSRARSTIWGWHRRALYFLSGVPVSFHPPFCFRRTTAQATWGALSTHCPPASCPRAASSLEIQRLRLLWGISRDPHLWGLIYLPSRAPPSTSRGH